MVLVWCKQETACQFMLTSEHWLRNLYTVYLRMYVGVTYILNIHIRIHINVKLCNRMSSQQNTHYHTYVWLVLGDTYVRTYVRMCVRISDMYCVDRAF